MITVEEAKHQARVDHDEDDGWFELIIAAVSEAIRVWLKDDEVIYEHDSAGDPILDSAGEMIPRNVVKLAALVEVAMHYRYREGDASMVPPAHWGHGYVLSVGATALLQGLRRPTVA